MRPVPVFDLGNVLVRVDFAPFFSFLRERASGVEEASLRGLLGSSLFFELEFGAISFSQFHKRLVGRFSFDGTERELAVAFNSIFPGPVPGMAAVLEELASRGPVYGLSNTNEIHLQYCLEHFPELAKVQFFASHELGARKPFVGTYFEVAKRIGVSSPSELVFFDDVASNVKGALAAGWGAHLFPAEGGVDLVKSVLLLDDKVV